MVFGVVPPIPDAEPLSPELSEALRMYVELKRRCNLRLGTTVHVQKGQTFEDSDLYDNGRIIGTEDLFEKYPDQLTSLQRETLTIGMPKVYWAFEQVGFPDLDLREVLPGYPGSFTSFGTIYFDEFSGMGRNFGTRISLLNDSKEKILEALQERLDNSVFNINAKTKRSKNRGFVDDVMDRADIARSLAVEQEREAIRRKMRGLDGDNNGASDRS